MTSAKNTPNLRTNNTYNSDKGGRGVKKAEHVAGVIYGSPLWVFVQLIFCLPWPESAKHKPKHFPTRVFLSALLICALIWIDHGCLLEAFQIMNRNGKTSWLRVCDVIFLVKFEGKICPQPWNFLGSVKRRYHSKFCDRKGVKYTLVNQISD